MVHFFSLGGNDDCSMPSSNIVRLSLSKPFDRSNATSSGYLGIYEAKCCGGGVNFSETTLVIC